MSEEDKRTKVAKYSLDQVTRYVNQRNYARAFPHYLVFAQLERNQFLENHVDKFLEVTSSLVEHLQMVSDAKVVKVFEEAIEVVPNNAKLLTNYGSYLFKAKDTEKAEKLFREALKYDPKYLEAKDRLENLASSLLERWHFPMLNDVTRNTKFKAAIDKLVANGCDTILDIGTGTGLLSLIAASAGAQRVYACEVSEVMLITAREVFIHNREAGDKVRLIPKLSVDMTNEDVPEKVSLLVTETFDSGLLGEHVLESLHHAHRNLLADNGRIVPGAAIFYIAPIQSKYISQNSVLDVDNIGYLDIKIRLKADMSLSDGSIEPYQSESLSLLRKDVEFLSQPKKLFSVNFNSLADIEEFLVGKSQEVNFEFSRDGQLDAIAGWFELLLDNENTIKTSMEDKSCWDQVIFPVSKQKRKVYKNMQLSTKFTIKNHINLDSLEIGGYPSVNGNGATIQREKVDMNVSSDIIQQLNSAYRASVSQWVAYYVVRDLMPSSLLDISLRFPDIGLQILKLKPDVTMTMMVDTQHRRQAGHMLDLVTTVARDNDIAMTRIDCVTPQTMSDDRYNVVLLSPVLMSGRLNTDCLLELENIKNQFDTSRPSMFLPHSVQLFCVTVECPQLDIMSHLVSDDNVLGYKICDQVNILSVTHQQDLLYSGLDCKELCDPVQVTTLDLANVSLKRQELSVCVPVTTTGEANAIVYWFVQEYGWNITENTKDAEEFKQAAFIIPHTELEMGDMVEIQCQMESGLVDLSFGQVTKLDL